MTQTCKDCQHWSPAQYHEPFGYCSSDKWQGGYHVHEKDLASDMCHHEDDEGWGVTTGPDFGCIHHKAKP